LSSHIAATDHQRRLVDRLDLRVLTVLIGHQLGAAPDVEVGDHGAV